MTARLLVEMRGALGSNGFGFTEGPALPHPRGDLAAYFRLSRYWTTSSSSLSFSACLGILALGIFDFGSER